jgi:hypothetical protein
MNLKDIKVQVSFTEDSIPRVVNAELTAKGFDDLEKIADKHAIGFYNWMQDNYFQIGDGFLEDRNMDKSKRVIITTEKAMLIYKKENGI